MDANQLIEESIEDNISLFTNSFFQRHIPELKTIPVQLNNEVTKQYQFPALYGNVSCSMGIFFCNYHKAKKALAHQDLYPLKMLKNRSIIIFSTYEYRNVLGIKGYNEIGMTIPVFHKKSGPPVLPLLKKGMKDFGYNVISMPVTSLENQLRGLRIWGLPKVVERIDINIEDGINVTKAYDENNENYFTLKIPTSGERTELDEQNTLYSVNDGQSKITNSFIQGNFKINKFSKRILFSDDSDSDEFIKIGTGKRAEFLKNLQINPNPLQLRFTQDLSSCVYFPENLV
jgi:hypothetical protein